MREQSRGKPSQLASAARVGRVGIFSGTFDPVHAGHIAFALAAAEQAGLSRVYFMPEQLPRRKQGVTHYAHRLAMLRLALKPYQKLDLLELPDRQFSVRSSWPRLKKQLAGAGEIYMLIGSDMLNMLHGADAAQQWPGYEQLLAETRLIVGVRSEFDSSKTAKLLAELTNDGQIAKTDWPHVLSSSIRNALLGGGQHSDLLGTLKGYARRHWLYASPPQG